MTTTNVMISCAGKQTLLVNAFKEALKGNGQVFATDNNPYAPALSVADQGLIAPQIYSEEYEQWIVDKCKKHNIHLLLTLLVDDLEILEKQREKFAELNCFLAGAPLDIIKTCKDKIATSQFCKKNGFSQPKIWTEEGVKNEITLPWPLIVKERYGQASKGLKKVLNKKELDFILEEKDVFNRSAEYVFQEMIEGIEYGFDIVNDFDRTFKAIFPRKKIAMKGGETDIAETLDPTVYQKFGRLLGNSLKHQGLVDVDAMNKDDILYVIDINLRFGGGYAFSHLAGANIPAVLISWIQQIETNPEWFEFEYNIKGSRSSFIQKLIRIGESN